MNRRADAARRRFTARAAATLLACALGASGCTKFVGDYRGDVTVSVRFDKEGAGPAPVTSRKYPVVVRVRKAVDPKGGRNLLVDIQGAPFGSCALEAQSSGRGILFSFAPPDCGVSTSEYSGRLPKGAGLGGIQDGKLSFVYDVQRTKVSGGTLSVNLEFEGRRAP